MDRDAHVTAAEEASGVCEFEGRIVHCVAGLGAMSSMGDREYTDNSTRGE